MVNPCLSSFRHMSPSPSRSPLDQSQQWCLQLDSNTIENTNLSQYAFTGIGFAGLSVNLVIIWFRSRANIQG